MSLKRSLIETIGRVFFTKASVMAARELAPKLWRIDLSSSEWLGTKYTPGDKVQVMLDDGPRTYSPFAVNQAHGTLSVISYAHGTSCGAQWGPTARAKDAVTVFGPRSSIPLPTLGTTPLLIGDETGLGIARALHELHGERARYVFETDDAAAMQEAVTHLELANATIIARRAGDAHHAELGDRVVERAKVASGFALTGKATTIQALCPRLKTAVPTATQRVKAYWAPGKRGLD